nr:hypothetical protein [uncultured Anaerostipes sp.]
MLYGTKYINQRDKDYVSIFKEKVKEYKKIHYKVSDDKSGTLFFVQMDYQGPFGYGLSLILMVRYQRGLEMTNEENTAI